MKKYLLLWSFTFSFISLVSQPLMVDELVCDYKVNPIGIDNLTPQLSWKIKSSNNQVRQVAYHIRVAKSERDLAQNRDLVWDSQKVNSEQSVHIDYSGAVLLSRTEYYWQVKIWDNHGNESPWSEVDSWEMALLSPEEWQAEWISSTISLDTSVRSQPCPYFRKEFSVNSEIESARLYVTAHGLYEGFINGERVGDREFAPGWTSYQNRLQYQTYDVTSYINRGDNCIGFVLGDGWYRGFIGFSGQHYFYGDELALLAQLEIRLRNGRTILVLSDGSWRSSTGPIVMSDIYNGEFYDARKEITGWSRPGFNSAGWDLVESEEHDLTRLLAEEGVPIRKIMEIKPRAIITSPKGEIIYDMGQNMVGWIRLRVNGERGQSVVISHAEVLDNEGNFYTENLRAAQAKLTYICRGGEEEIYEPSFTFMGFRYVRVEGIENPTLDDITGVVIHSEMEATGEFSCSHPLINQLQHNIQWGQRGNFLDVPTDCPQRDERLGWTGDAQAFSNTAAYNFQVAPFFIKWLKDLSADQNPDGSVPFVIPNVLGPRAAASTGWADAVTIIPWNLYVVYGDKQFLSDQYESMKAWVEYMEDKAGEDHLWNTGFHFGDWLFYSPQDDRDGRAAITDKYLIAQAFFAHSVDIVKRSATILGNEMDEKYYSSLWEKVVNAFRDEYVTTNGRLVSSTQTAYVLALAFDLFPEELRAQAAERLHDNINQYDHLTTGFLGTPHLCHVLSEYGYLDLAYELLLNEKYPSWLYPVTQGATTIWERWDGIRPDGSFQNAGMNSFNHYAYGAIGDWIYKNIAGINPDPDFPGYKQIFIEPKPGGNITNATARLQSVYGEIGTQWELDDGHIDLTFKIPPNTRAILKLEESVSSSLEWVEPAGFMPEKEAETDGGFYLQSIGSGEYKVRYPIN
jgi:alpha-L-rhamnosidase